MVLAQQETKIAKKGRGRTKKVLPSSISLEKNTSVTNEEQYLITFQGNIVFRGTMEGNVQLILNKDKAQRILDGLSALLGISTD